VNIFRFILILISIYLSLMRINGLPFSLTWGDVTFMAIFFIFVIDYIKGYIFFNKFSRLFIFYNLLLIISALINGNLTAGPLLNILRTNVEGFVFFSYIYSLISRERITKKIFFKGSLVLFISFSVTTIPQLQQMWASEGFTNYQVFESSLNLNSWGYIMYLFFFLSLVSYLNGIFKPYSVLAASIIAGMMIFSFSRNVYTISIITLAWIIFYILKIDIKKLIIPVVLIFTIFVFLDFQHLLNLTISEEASDFWNIKSQTYQNDLVNTRFYLINVLPIQEIFYNFNIFQIFFGDAISVQHSFIAHSLIVTGIVGLFLFLYRFLSAFRYARITNSCITKHTSKLLMIFIITFLLNDFITNSSAFLPIGSYLSYIIFGYLFADIELSRWKKLEC